MKYILSIIISIYSIFFAKDGFSQVKLAEKQKLRITIPSADTDLHNVNPARGAFSWFNLNEIPQTEELSDKYLRLSWVQLEHGEGQYDFSVIEKSLNGLKPGQRIAFGVEALNSCCSMFNGVEVPDYIVKRPGKSFSALGRDAPRLSFVPDWNDSFFLDRVTKLFEALGRKYNGDPRIAWMEIRIYGDWGEWHVSRFLSQYKISSINKLGAQPATFESKKRIILAQVLPFSKTQLVMMTDDTEALLFALKLNTTIPIGMKRDSWGSKHFEADIYGYGKPIPAQDKDLIDNRWKIAPFFVEPMGRSALEKGEDGILNQVIKFHISAIANGNIGTGKWGELSLSQKQAMLKAVSGAGYRLNIKKIEYPASVSSGYSFLLGTEWENTGSAPVYEKWRVKFELLKSEKMRDAIWVGYSNIELGKIMPESSVYSQKDEFKFNGVKPGTYLLIVSVVDPFNYRLPMKLAIKNALPNGRYALGSIEVNGQK